MRKIIICLFLFVMLAFTFVFPAKASIVFSDNFNRPDGSLGSDWTVVSGTWAIENEVCTQNDTSWQRYRAVAGDSNWRDFSVTLKTKIVEGMGAIVLFRYVNNENWYEAFVRQDIDKAVISKVVAGKITWIVSTPFTCDLGVWYRLRVDVSGNLIRFYINDVIVLEATDSTFGKGKIGIGALHADARFDDVVVNNPIPELNRVPEPATLVILIVLIAGVASYVLIHRKPIDKKTLGN